VLLLPPCHYYHHYARPATSISTSTTTSTNYYYYYHYSLTNPASLRYGMRSMARKALRQFVDSLEHHASNDDVKEISRITFFCALTGLVGDPKSPQSAYNPRLEHDFFLPALTALCRTKTGDGPMRAGDVNGPNAKFGGKPGEALFNTRKAVSTLTEPISSSLPRFMLAGFVAGLNADSKKDMCDMDVALARVLPLWKVADTQRGMRNARHVKMLQKWVRVAQQRKRDREDAETQAALAEAQPVSAVEAVNDAAAAPAEGADADGAAPAQAGQADEAADHAGSAPADAGSAPADAGTPLASPRARIAAARELDGAING